MRVCCAALVAAWLSLMALGRRGSPLLDGFLGAPRGPRSPQLAGARRHEALFGLRWTELPASESAPGRWPCSVSSTPAGSRSSASGPGRAGRGGRGRGAVPEVVLVGCRVRCRGRRRGLVRAAHERASRLLGLMQGWVADERFGGSRLVLVS